MSFARILSVIACFIAAPAFAQDRVAAPTVCGASLGGVVIGRDGSVVVNFDAAAFEAQYAEIPSVAPPGGRAARPSRDSIKAEIQEIARMKLHETFPGGPSGDPQKIKITISCKLSPKINCTLTVEF